MQAAEAVLEQVLFPRDVRFLVLLNLGPAGTDQDCVQGLETQEWRRDCPYPSVPHPVRSYKAHGHNREKARTVLEYAPNTQPASRSREDFFQLALTIE
ncbi:hypothetical protein [Streptomyces sp. NPDC056105]|uniref:hypothetical protein n=1 Tax=Streptomyces sp. NPDC056105 TaxID=3345714 RepID=UPI0035D94B8E